MKDIIKSYKYNYYYKRDRKYVFIGKESSDITSEIIKLIDKNTKQ